MEMEQEMEQEMISLYEQSRRERIKENLKRMENLGLVDLSLKLKSSIHPKVKSRKPFDPKSPRRHYAAQSSEPHRRSSRLQNTTPVSYSEVHFEKNKCLDVVEEGSKPEVYTEEHEKLLGNTQKSWVPFVDGYGKDGKRIYDPLRGKTCHQCRQKTLGHRTHCSRCNLVQGQFCGDCLYMRYGEHVLEAQQNPDWICPVCRGICNCSLCRQAKGWPATGQLYKKISNMGFKSVAHFLIQTRRSHSEQNPNNQMPARRSLPFTDFEATPDGSPKVSDKLLESLEQHSEDKRVSNELKNEKQMVLQCSSNHDAKRPLPFSNIGRFKKVKYEIDNRADECEGDRKEEMGSMTSNVTDEKFRDEKKLRAAVYLSRDSIAGRLRQRWCRKGKDDDVADGLFDQASDVSRALTDISESKMVEIHKEMHGGNDDVELKDKMSAFVEEPNQEGIFKDSVEKKKQIVGSNDSAKRHKNKHGLVADHNQDSIAGRLKQRRGKGGNQADGSHQ